MNERTDKSLLDIYDRALLLHGCRRNQELTLAEIERYGLDSFANSDYLSIYGMPPREWYHHGIRVLGRTAVECTGDALGDRIGRDVASVATRMPVNEFGIIDPFAGSCNTLFWIIRHLPNSEGIAVESDPQVFELTRRNLTALSQRIELVHGDYEWLLPQLKVPAHRGIVAFVAPPWGSALDEVEGLDLCRTAPPVTQVIEQIARHFQKHKILIATQVYEKVDTTHWHKFKSDSNGVNCVSTTSTRQAAEITVSFWERKAGHREQGFSLGSMRWGIFHELRVLPRNR